MGKALELPLPLFHWDQHAPILENAPVEANPASEETKLAEAGCRILHRQLTCRAVALGITQSSPTLFSIKHQLSRGKAAALGLMTGLVAGLAMTVPMLLLAWLFGVATPIAIIGDRLSVFI